MNTKPVALVTGGASGIGLAIVNAILEAGYFVAIIDIKKAEDMSLPCDSRGRARLEYIVADVADHGQAKLAVKMAIKRFRRLDLVVCAAGILGPPSVTDADAIELERVVNVNLLGVGWINKEAIPVMVQQGGGVIINISSISALTGSSSHPFYAATKGGVISLTKSLAKAYGRNRIRVNCLCLGSVVGTKLGKEENVHFSQKHETNLRLALKNKVPLGQTLKPDDIARWVLFIASADGSCVTGVNYVIDAGESLGT